MKRIRRSLKGHYWRKVITYFLTCCLILNASLPVATALESGDITDSSGIIGTPLWGDHTTIDTDHGAIIDWNNFNTSSGQIVQFRQYLDEELSNMSAVLNRVSSGSIPTEFNGALNANGRVFVVNPAGVIFGAGSTVNVTQLVASGLNMSNDAFHAFLDNPDINKMEFAGGNGGVTSRAHIMADSVYLIGKKVYNFGVIQAPNGLVVMAAGDEVRLYENGSDVSVVVSDIGYSLDIRNSNIVSADNGKIVLAAGDTFSRAISNVSIIAASGGEVSIQAAQVENRGWIIVNSSSGDGGSISLTGTEQVVIGPDIHSNPSQIFANAGANGNGGDITIQTDGKLTIEENSLITASGGSVSGDGGSVTITCDDFEIADVIYASPGNKIEEPGKLEINTSSSATENVTIADGANAGAMNTIYEEDIEALSQAGTSLIVNAEKGITVKNITDGEITGQFGSIELYATGDDSAVTFADDTDTIRTTLGDIIIEAGSGGIDVGNLITGKDLAGEKPAPGKIFLTTNNGGDIETGDLIIESGWGHAEINVKSDGNLTVDGDVKVGKESYIYNVLPSEDEPLGAAAEAMIYLKAADNVVINGQVCADAHGSEDAVDITKAYIEITAGGDAEINGDLWAKATSSSSGTADAVITVNVAGEINFPGTATAIANDATAESTEPHSNDEETTSTGYALIDFSAIVLFDDFGIFSAPKSGADIVLDVLDNDTLEEGSTIVDPPLLDNPAEGSLSISTGDKTVLIYNPPEDLSVLTFDENGEAVVTFTYTVDGKTAAGDITLINGLPVAVEDSPTTTMDQSVTFDVLVNDSDPDLDDVLTAIKVGDITTKFGTLVQNEDGTFTYTPNEGFVGDDSFMYLATDSFNTSSIVKVKITVKEPTSYIPPAPGLDSLELEIEISGCPALVKWAAEEVGIDQRLVQVWVANSLASTGNIQPCDACEGLRNAAKILQDADGTHIAALAQVINEFASSTAPPTEEQMASIADAIARNTDAESYYAIADEYLDALATYVGILSSEMGFSATESIQLVTDKYVGRFAQGQDVGVATFIAASLAALGG